MGKNKSSAQSMTFGSLAEMLESGANALRAIDSAISTTGWSLPRLSRQSSNRSQSKSRRMPTAHAESSMIGSSSQSSGNSRQRTYTIMVTGNPAGIESAKQALKKQGFTINSTNKNS